MNVCRTERITEGNASTISDLVQIVRSEAYRRYHHSRGLLKPHQPYSSAYSMEHLLLAFLGLVKFDRKIALQMLTS